MRNTFRAILTSTCIITLLTCPFVARANECSYLMNNQQTAIPENPDGIIPFYTDKAEYSVQNGETVYFVNNLNGLPFLIRENTLASVVLSFTDYSNNFETGIVDEHNNVMQSFDNNNECRSIGIIFSEAMNTGRYKFYLTNFSDKPITLNKFKVGFYDK